MQVVKELETVEVPAERFPRRRVVVLRRDDGCYTFAEQYFFVTEIDGRIVAQGWQTLPASSVCATIEIADLEARAAFAHWYRTTD